MSGDHNMFCSANQPDIVDRLRGIDCSWSDEGEIAAAAADEIERLRKELAQRPRIDEHMLKGATDTAAVIVNELREQLAACQRDMQDLNVRLGLEIGRKNDELAACQRDAERYRWLRDTQNTRIREWDDWMNNAGTIDDVFVSNGDGSASSIGKEEFDDLIDAAMEADTSAHEETEYLAELNRGYAKDRI